MKRLWFLPLIFCFFQIGLSLSAKAAAPVRTKTELLAEITNWRDQIIKEEIAPEAFEWSYRLQFLVERRFDGSEASILRLLEFDRELSEDQDRKWLTSMIESIKELKEPEESTWTLIRGFLEMSDFENPLSPDEFMNLREAQ
jgi:hypothetical protein